MDGLLRDLHHSARALGSRPGFLAIAVLTIGLGVGAATTIFSAVDSILLEPLAYPEPERLVRLIGTRTDGGESRATISLPDFNDWRVGTASLASAAAYDEWTAVLTSPDEAERVAGASVTSGFFTVLGVDPALGRFFQPADDRAGHEPVVVLSHSLWRRRFGADPAVIGRSLAIGGVTYRVVGVTSPEFEDPGLSGAAFGAPEIWRVTPDYFDPDTSTRSSRAFTAIARLPPGLEVDRVNAELAAITASLAERFPETNAGRSARAVRLYDEIVGPVRPALLLLLGGAGLLLVTTCANVGNLLLARGSSRARELAVRRSLGATRSRIVRQLTTESLLLACAGGAAGVAIAAWMIPMVRTLSASDLVRADRIVIDASVLGFAVVVSSLAALLFGLVPSLITAETGFPRRMHGGARGGTASGRRVQRFFVAAQLAGSVLLLSIAMLFARSLWSLRTEDTGLRTDGVLTLELSPPPDRYDTDEEVRSLYDAIEARVAAVPGVANVGFTSILPLTGNFNGMAVRKAEDPENVEPMTIETRVVMHGAFPALGIPIVRGRSLTPADREGSRPVVVVDRAAAEALWPGEDAIGRHVVFGRRAWAGVEREVVGIVGDTRQFRFDRPPEPTVYLPRGQVTEWGPNATLVASSRGDGPSPAAAIRAAIREVAPLVAIGDVRSMAEVAASATGEERFRTRLTGLFAAAALLLGGVGIFGLVGHAVSARTRELGIRMALGAPPRRLVRWVLGTGMQPVGLGLLVGLPLALGSSRLLRGMLYGVGPADPLTYAVVAIALVGVALVASWMPTRAALRVDPAITLRSE